MEIALGLMVSIVFLAAYIPQLKTLYIQKEVYGISKVFWMFIALATTITAGTLIEEKAEWFVILPQCINSFIAIVILLWVAYKKYKFYGVWVYLMNFVFFVSILINWVDNDIVQHWSSLLITFAYVEQITHLIYRKTAQGVNFLLYLGFAVGLVIMITNMLITGAPLSATITETVNLIMMSIATIITMILNKKHI